MERSRNGKFDCTTCTASLGVFNRLAHRFGVTCDHDLTGRIEVHRFDSTRRTARLTSGFHFFIGKADDGGHAAHTHRNGRLHGFGTEANELHSLFEREDARSTQSRVFAERMTREHFRFDPACSEPSFVKRNGRRQHCRLRVHREVEFFGRTLSDEAFDRETERFVGTTKGGLDRFIIGKTAEHPDRLTALAGEDECNTHGEESFVGIPLRKVREV